MSAPAQSGPDRPPTSDLLAQASAIEGKVAQLRGLPLRAPLKKGVRDRDQLRATLLQKIAEEYSDEQLADEGKVYKQLDLLDEKDDYKAIIVDLLTDQIAGFYDQDIDTLFIMQGLPAAMQRPTMAHEIFHGIQDQHFDLNSLIDPLRSTEHGDFALARSALIEGDATVLMMDFLLHEEGDLPSGTITSVAQMFTPSSLGALNLERLMGLQLGEAAQSPIPPFLQESLVFPYTAGLAFIISAYHQGRSWETINALYDVERAPVSTEQIMHPERYFAGDEPVWIEFEGVERALGTGWRTMYKNVAGEFQIRLYLRQHLSRPKRGAPLIDVDVDRAAEGWDGDRVIALEHVDGRRVLVQLSVWDSTPDALEYYDALRASITRRHHDHALRELTSEGKHGRAVCAALTDERGAGSVYIEQWGDTVLHVEGDFGPAPEDGSNPARALRAPVYESLTRTPLSQIIAANANKKSP